MYQFFYKSKLSQWHMVDFIVHGVIYSCPEQYMMASKALLFEDSDSFDKIMEAKHPREQQLLGREVKNYKQSIWDKNKVNIVHKGNYHRFSQNEECKQLLIDTFPKFLVEASPVDRVWGIGLSSDNNLINDPKNWRGENLLGQVLTLVRTEIMLDIKPIFPGYIK